MIEQKDGFGLVPVNQELGGPMMALEPPEESEENSLYEEAVTVLEEWALESFEKKGHQWKIWLQEIEQEKALIFVENSVDFDENNVPGLWVGDVRGKSRQHYFKPVLPYIHLLLSGLEPRAARGLFFRIPRLSNLVKGSRLTDGRVLTIITSAANAAACHIDTDIDYKIVYESEIFGGCLFGLPSALFGILRNNFPQKA